MAVGFASRPFIPVSAADLTRSKSLSSKRGFDRTSCTNSRVGSKFRAKVVTLIRVSSRPELTEIFDPNKPMARSSSAAVFVAVPSFMRFASSANAPDFSATSFHIPPEKVISKLTSGISSFSMPRTCVPLVNSASQISGIFIKGSSPKGGSERSNFVGVFLNSATAPALTSSFATPDFTSSIQTLASSEPLRAKSAWPLGTKLVMTAFLSLI